MTQSEGTDSGRVLAFLWENFGPMHLDRCEAVGRHMPGDRVVGIELFAQSSIYEWTSPTPNFRKVTLFSKVQGKSGRLTRFRAILGTIRRERATHVFFCHYNRPEVFAAAWILRLLGRRVFVMSCSKYDDMPRRAVSEALKSLALTPYQGAMSSGKRPRDYLRSLGIDARHIHGEYNTLSIERMRLQAGVPSAPAGEPFATRQFVAVARLVPKKNLAMLIDAYAAYRQLAGPAARGLAICGSGPLEVELRMQAAALGVADWIEFTGFVQSDAVSGYLARGLALLLPSIEEQFGNVVIEAQALGVPVILSDNCGARDTLVRSGVNGFVIEPDNPAGMAFFMDVLSRDQALWERMCGAASASAAGGDVARFAEGIDALVNRRPATI